MASEIVSGAEQIGALINKGRYRKAQRLAGTFNDDPQATGDAYYFLQFALAEQMNGNTSRANELWERAKKCANYTLLDEGDFFRDVSLAALRAGHIKKATDNLNEALIRHLTDSSRLTAIVMVRGRICYAQQQYEDAVDNHKKADHQWRIAEPSDPQWIKNNRFHWLRAACAVKSPDHEMIMRLSQQIYSSAPNWNHQVGTWLAVKGGRRGNAVYDLLVRIVQH